MNIKEYEQRLRNIRYASFEDLRNKEILEELIIPNLGLADKCYHQWPEKLHKHFGGLELWQYPNQLSKLLAWLSHKNIKSFVEIGTYKGGTFVTFYEYLKRFNPISKAISVDKFNHLIIPNEYMEKNSKYINIILDNNGSNSDLFSTNIKDKMFDMAFIDGDHHAVNMFTDYLLLKDKCKIIIFHDICSVCKIAWGKVKHYNNEQNKFKVLEIIDQYNLQSSYMGYGILF